MEVSVQLYKGDGSDWDEYVLSHMESANYHLYGWRNVIEKSFGHQTYYLAARDSDSKICGILPLAFMKSSLFGKFLVSLPFFNYGGMLVSCDEASQQLLKESIRILREARGDYVELRHRSKSLSGLQTKEHKVTMILDLEKDEEVAWRSLDGKVRNQVRKAEKSGLQAVTGHLELLDCFYDVFCRNMRDLGTPVYSKDFFRNTLAAFPDSTRIISIQLSGRTIASGILTWFKETLEVPWASSNKDYREMCPNNLLYWEAVKYAIHNGSSRFDFGRSTPGEGTYRFKKQWGALPYQLYWQYILDENAPMPQLNPSNQKYRIAVNIWQRLPVCVTKLLGPKIVRSIP
jgi:serine/alanine adding enzyme